MEHLNAFSSKLSISFGPSAHLLQKWGFSENVDFCEGVFTIKIVWDPDQFIFSQLIQQKNSFFRHFIFQKLQRSIIKQRLRLNRTLRMSHQKNPSGIKEKRRNTVVSIKKVLSINLSKLERIKQVLK
jgi:hypothetical protein